VDALKHFLEDFPGHKEEASARQVVHDAEEGQDVFDLLKERKIEIETEGTGIESVSVRIRRLVPYPLTVRIPTGSYFVAANPSSQNMVTTSETKVELLDDGWASAQPDAACSNRPRHVPGNDDTFTVQRAPQQAELAQLMPVIGKANVEYAVRQAAVWIVTDNADYDDLGILVESATGIGGTRVINEEETARAMKICQEAGIDIQHKAIWNDREVILQGLKDHDLKSWLAGYDKKTADPGVPSR
jgi:hypothetical protein